MLGFLSFFDLIFGVIFIVIFGNVASQYIRYEFKAKAINTVNVQRRTVICGQCNEQFVCALIFDKRISLSNIDGIFDKYVTRDEAWCRCGTKENTND